MEKNWKPGSSCLVENGGKVMETGAQAECYANYYIALHLEESAKRAGYDGETYASIGAKQTALRTQATEAKAKNDPQAAELQKQLDAVNNLRDTQFRGETLRGLLLTSYGFSIFGEKAALAASICFGIAAVAVLLSVAGFVHALVTPREELVLGGQLTRRRASGFRAPCIRTLSQRRCPGWTAALSTSYRWGRAAPPKATAAPYGSGAWAPRPRSFRLTPSDVTTTYRCRLAPPASGRPWGPPARVEVTGGGERWSRRAGTGA
ncbi:MAG: hypothetical protein U0531_05485 [Dehalococcoidia bacterium]